MPDLLTHWAVVEDLRRIAAADPKMSGELNEIIDAERQFARLGSVSRGGKLFVPHILRKAREEWSKLRDSNAPETGLLRRKIAYAVGGVAHFPADYIMKPILSQVAGVDWNDTHHAMQKGVAAADAVEVVQEISVYYDVEVFREIYLNGDEEPFNRFLLAANPPRPVEALEELITSLFQRALIASHTLAPDGQNLDSWLDNLMNQVQPLYLSIQRYAKVFNSPDPKKIEKYGVRTAFYRKDDPAVALARALARGKGADGKAIDAAAVDGANQGGYGRALELGIQCMRQVSDFWERRSDELPDLSQG